VMVIGGGNTAIDAATIAKCLGAERVTMIYGRSREEMTACDSEVKFVQDEGVDVRLMTQPIEIISENGAILGLRCVRTALGEPDDSGRRRLEPIAGSEFVLLADQVIKAIGQEKLTPLFEALGVQTEYGYVKTVPELRSSNPKVIAAGVCPRLSGHALTVTAAQDGKIAAAAIARQLGIAPEVEPLGAPTGRPVLTTPATATVAGAGEPRQGGTAGG